MIFSSTPGFESRIVLKENVINDEMIVLEETLEVLIRTER